MEKDIIYIMKKYKICLMAVGLSFLLGSCQITPNPGDIKEDTHLSLFAINDFHGSYSYDEGAKQTGLSRIGEYLINEKKSDPNTIVLASGDIFQGGAESNLTRGEVVIDAMNEIGFDAMSVGNHEFDWGEETLKEMANKMDFPLLNTNIFYKGTENQPEYFDSSVVINKGNLRVGIVGSVAEGIGSSILSSVSKDFDYLNPTFYAAREARRLRVEEKCDVVILSTHDGSIVPYKDLAKTDIMTNKRFIDALFLGHSHQKMEGYLDSENKVPYLQGGNNGKYISNIELDIKVTNNEYEVKVASSKNISTFETCKSESSVINENYLKYKDHIEEVMNEVLTTLPSYASKTSLLNYALKSMYDYFNAHLEIFKEEINMSFMNSGGIRSSAQPGVFTYGDLIKVIPFDNALCVAKVTQSQYRSAKFNAHYEGKTPDFENSEFVYIGGIDYVATKDTFQKEELYMYNDQLLRDVVAENIRLNGYEYL